VALTDGIGRIPKIVTYFYKLLKQLSPIFTTCGNNKKAHCPTTPGVFSDIVVLGPSYYIDISWVSLQKWVFSNLKTPFSGLKLSP